MKYIVTFCLMCLGYAAIGQVTIIPMPHQAGYFTLEDLWRVNLINAQSQAVGAQLEVTVENAQHQLILSAASPVFNLLQGSNRPAFNASSAKIQYGSSPATSVLRSTGKFPYGDYIVCYRVMASSNSALLGELCQEETVKPFSPPELVSPFNGETITTVQPLLTWKPPFPPGATPFEYTLRLVLVKDAQDATEALESNPPLLSRRGIFGTVLPYPGDVPRLETGKTYAWQVSAKAGSYDLGTTEIWKFTVGQESSRAVQVFDPPLFVAVRKQLDNRYTFAPAPTLTSPLTATIYFKFYQDYDPANDVASYKIYNWQKNIMAQGNLTGIKLGANFKTVSFLSPVIGDYYILEIKTNKGNLYYLRVKTYDPDSM